MQIHCEAFLVFISFILLHEVTLKQQVVIPLLPLLIHTLSIYRPDESIVMKVFGPYSLHQSKPTDGI